MIEKTVAMSDPACRLLAEPIFKKVIGSMGTLGDVGREESTMGSK